MDQTKEGSFTPASGITQWATKSFQEATQAAEPTKSPAAKDQHPALAILLGNHARNGSPTVVSQVFGDVEVCTTILANSH